MNEQMLQRFLDFESKTRNLLQQKHISFSEWWQVEDVASVVLCFCHVYNQKHSKLVARIRGTSKEDKIDV